MAGALVGAQLLDETVRRVNIEDARLQRDQDLVGNLHHLVELAPLKRGRRVEHDMGGAAGRARQPVLRRVPAENGWQVRRAQVKPGV
jgi:hypothetical protein